MAIDRWMLQRLAAGGGPMLRFYRWSQPTLSLGLHQQRLEPHWSALAASGALELVRRPSGGRAVLHAGDLTYALVCHPVDGHRQRAYAQACRWLLEGFAGLGHPLQFGCGDAVQAQRRPSCFATATAADLVEANGAKRIGSAQLWRGPALLQHGSVLVAPDTALWQRVFGEAPPPLPPLSVDPPELEASLRQAAMAHLCDGPMREQGLTSEEWQAVEALRQQPPVPPGRSLRSP